MTDIGDSNFEDEFGLDVQKKFIGLLLRDKTWAELNGFDIIKPEYFQNKILKLICKWIHDYHREYKDFPTKLVLSEQAKTYVNDNHLPINEYFLYTTALDDIFFIEGGEADIEFFKNKAITFVRQQAWKAALGKGTDALKINNYQEAIDKFREVLTLGAENDLGIDYSTITPEEFISVLGETYDKSNMIQTGIEAWDDALGGGFVKDNVHLLGGAPGFGKSRAMAFLAKQAVMQGKRVVFITLELNQAETMANIESAVTGFRFFELLRPENLQSYKEKHMQFINKYGDDLFIKFYKPATITCDTIHNYIQKVIQYKKEKFGMDWKPDVIYLDYLDKLLPIQKIKGNLYEDIGGVVDDCKNLAISFHCPVISGSQLGRNVWNLRGSEVVSLDSLADSSRKAHLAHSITTINVNPGEKSAGKARLFMAKSRSGRPGTTIYIEQDLGRCNMYEVEPWDPATLQGTTTYTVKSVSGS